MIKRGDVTIDEEIGAPTRISAHTLLNPYPGVLFLRASTPRRFNCSSPPALTCSFFSSLSSYFPLLSLSFTLFTNSFFASRDVQPPDGLVRWDGAGRKG